MQDMQIPQENLPKNNVKKTTEALMSKLKGRIAEILPKMIDKERFCRVVSFELAKESKLLQCTQHSLVNCVIEATRLGLEIGGIRGECYLIPYKDKCTFILGYQGMLSLLFKSGKVKSICVQDVYENDAFDFEYGSSSFIYHKPSKGNRGQFVAVYVQIELSNGSKPFEVMWKDDVDKIREHSIDYKYKKENSIWGKYYSQMAKKSVIRGIFKYLPLTQDLQRAIIIDENADTGNQDDLFDVEVEEIDDDEKNNTRADKIVEKIGNNNRSNTC